MATENITVEHQKTSTASFNVKTRTLTVPILDRNISPFLYDLFMGHEVGHALYTPLEGLNKVFHESIPQSIVNVVEDCRIERKIRYEYPGLRASFVKGYTELLEKNFFKTEGINLNTMNFIDRLNMHCKGGAKLGIKFSREERDLLNQVESTESFDDVMEVSRRIAAFMKKQQEQQKELEKISGSERYDSSYDEYDDEDEIIDSLDQDDLEGNFANSFGGEESEDSDSDENSPIKFGNNGGADYDESLKSFTDEAYRQNESKLFEADPDSIAYVNIPEFNGNDFVVDYKKVYAEIKKTAEKFHEKNAGYGTVTDGDIPFYEKLVQFRNENKSVVSYLTKEFELKKNADQLKRAATAKTGDLNMQKIFSYQFNEDIFRKITIVPEGKSHGLVMFMDWSGSMDRHLENTIKQLIALVMFCKKVNIPYEVYAFCDRPNNTFFDSGNHYPYEQNSRIIPKQNDLILNQRISLLNILSSRMSSAEFSYAGMTLVKAGETKTKHYTFPTWFCLNGTPLNEAILCASDVIETFKKKYKLQIVNAVFLTDGEAAPTSRVFHGPNLVPLIIAHTFCLFNSKNRRVVITDPRTKRQETISDPYAHSEYTSSFIKFLKHRTNCNILGFYILSSSHFRREISRFVPSTADVSSMRADFVQNKFCVVKSAGFDEYYILRAESLDTSDNDEFKVKENVTTRGLISAFSKYTKGRLTSRVVLNRFVEMIA